MPVLSVALGKLAYEPDKYRHLEPANHYGTVEDAIEIITLVLAEYNRIGIPKDELYFTT